MGFKLSDDEKRAVIAALPGRLDTMREARIARNADRRGRQSRRRRSTTTTSGGGVQTC